MDDHHQDSEEEYSSDTPPDALIDSSAALTYWSNIPANVNGMLGGYPQISRIDLRGSANFLTKLRRQASLSSSSSTSSSTSSGLPLLSHATDCGAGIGRVTLGFLSKVCEVVDLVEPVASFVEQIRHGNEMAELREKQKIGKVYQMSLEDWNPIPGRYDLIWNQWCLGHLTDNALVAYLKRCVRALKLDEESGVGGWVVVKENISTDSEKEDLYDSKDNSVTRTDEKFRSLFQKAGLKIVLTELQMGFPKKLGLLPVRFYALKPDWKKE
ncbi:MAG: hypothetical protein M1823_003887 [Watsoniomyces obsoletus]|nr:MAG: hypothetical protein M1823_003887 [Watsoniomyces obsoletus]